MRIIDYGINSYLKKCSLHIDFVPFWLVILENFFTFICAYLVPSIPLPKIKIIREDEKTTVKEYYGDLQQVFHLYVHNPIYEYCCRRTDSKSIELDYETARKVFYDKDKKFWDDEEKLAEEMRFEDEPRVNF
jgi:hypothetical protein